MKLQENNQHGLIFHVKDHLRVKRWRVDKRRRWTACFNKERCLLS